MSEEKQERPSEWKFKEPADGAARFYANQVNVFWSGVDATLVFGELVQSAEVLKSGVTNVEHTAKVTISWPVAKLLLTNLGAVMIEYEQLNGEVKLPGNYLIPAGNMPPVKE